MTEDPFAPAQKVAAKAKIGIYAVAGAGKTLTSLQLMRGLVGPQGKIALVDAEGGSSQTYADKFTFGLLVIRKPFTAAKFVAAIERAVEHNYDGLIIDGVSPWWEGEGGILQVADQSKRGDASGGWLTARPLQNAIESAIDNCPIHLICTIRAKNETVIEVVNGKQRPVQVGMKPTMSDSMRYVFGFLFYVNHTDHSLITSKHRWDVVDGMELLPDVGAEMAPAEQLGRDMREWLEAGVAVTPSPTEPAPTPTPAPPAAPAPATPPAAPASDDGGLLATTPPEPDLASSEQVDAILAKIAACKELDPESDWLDRVLGMFPKWFGSAKGIDQLTKTEAGVVAERLETTVLGLKQKKETTNA